MKEVWIQLIVSGAALFGGMFTLIKYSITQNKKREDAILEHTQKSQQMLYEYVEGKNGHMERIANRFADVSDKQTKAISDLAIEIKVMAAKK